jgi:hypothetical protein
MKTIRAATPTPTTMFFVSLFKHHPLVADYMIVAKQVMSRNNA